MNGNNALDDCAMELVKFEGLKGFIKDNLIGKWSIKDLVAEVYNLFQDYLISGHQEMELYNLVDPQNEEWNPAELWYSEKQYGCYEMYDFADGRI